MLYFLLRTVGEHCFRPSIAIYLRVSLSIWKLMMNRENPKTVSQKVDCSRHRRVPVHTCMRQSIHVAQYMYLARYTEDGNLQNNVVPCTCTCSRLECHEAKSCLVPRAQTPKRLMRPFPREPSIRPPSHHPPYYVASNTMPPCSTSKEFLECYHRSIDPSIHRSTDPPRRTP